MLLGDRKVKEIDSLNLKIVECKSGYFINDSGSGFRLNLKIVECK